MTVEAKLAALRAKQAENVLSCAEPIAQPGRFKQVIAEANKRNDAEGYAEMNRVLRLPIMQPLTPEEVDAISYEELDAKYYNKGERLFPPQAAGIATFDIAGGLFGSIGVGFGKTALEINLANRAYARGVERSLLFIPSAAYDEFIDYHLPWARNRFNIVLPSIIGMGQRTAQQRRKLAESGKKGLYVLPYSCLSTKDTSDVLAAIKPGLVIADEAHNLRHRHSARTKRVMALLQDEQPQFVCLSGTITNKSIRDYFHLIKAACGFNSPLPMTASYAADWCIVLDASAEKPSIKHMKIVAPLLDWARENYKTDLTSLGYDVDGFRRAYRYRLTSAPGVVATGDADIGVSLIIDNKPIKDYKTVAGWDKLADLMKKVEQEWITPSGDEMEHSIHKFKWLFELTAGFYNELVWPTETVFADRKKITVEKAKEILDGAKKHHAATQRFAKKLRKWLDENARAGLDTPLLVTSDMSRNGPLNVGPDLYALWRGAKDLEFEGMPERDSRPIRVCSFRIDEAVRWAQAHRAAKETKDKGALLWVYNQEIGEWLYEALLAAGLDAVHCPAGAQYDRLLKMPETANKIVVVGKSHMESKNLQAFQHQFLVQVPRSAKELEQLLGRTHRSGQTADELVVRMCNTLEFDHKNFGALLIDAVYAHDTDHRQKVVYATHTMRPKIYPKSFLRAQGFQPDNKITEKHEAELQERFGEKKENNNGA